MNSKKTNEKREGSERTGKGEKPHFKKEEAMWEILRLSFYSLYQVLVVRLSMCVCVVQKKAREGKSKDGFSRQAKRRKPNQRHFSWWKTPIYIYILYIYFTFYTKPKLLSR